VDKFVSAHAKLKAIEGEVETAKAQLKQYATDPFFKANAGQINPSSGIIAAGTENNEVMIGFKNVYGTGVDREVVNAIIGTELTNKFFHDKLSVKVDGDKIPADKRQLFIQKMIELGQELGIMDSIDAKVVVIPNKEFHELRHTNLTTSQNLQLHSVMPCNSEAKVRNSNAE
jgi:hypothetical protein